MMTYSKFGLALTERFESCRLTAYWDSKGNVWTIGWGTTGVVQRDSGLVETIASGMTCTELEADRWAAERTAKAAEAVNALVRVAALNAEALKAGVVTQGEFDALVDFAYNLGLGALEGSTLLRLLNSGDYAGASGEFEKWDHAGGQVLAGLLRRRVAEQAEFVTVDPDRGDAG